MPGEKRNRFAQSLVDLDLWWRYKVTHVHIERTRFDLPISPYDWLIRGGFVELDTQVNIGDACIALHCRWQRSQWQFDASQQV